MRGVLLVVALSIVPCRKCHFECDKYREEE